MTGALNMAQVEITSEEIAAIYPIAWRSLMRWGASRRGDLPSVARRSRIPTRIDRLSDTPSPRTCFRSIPGARWSRTNAALIEAEFEANGIVTTPSRSWRYLSEAPAEPIPDADQGKGHPRSLQRNVRKLGTPAQARADDRPIWMGPRSLIHE
jgi:hypothetical protein